MDGNNNIMLSNDALESLLTRLDNLASAIENMPRGDSSKSVGNSLLTRSLKGGEDYALSYDELNDAQKKQIAKDRELMNERIEKMQEAVNKLEEEKRIIANSNEGMLLIGQQNNEREEKLIEKQKEIEEKRAELNKLREQNVNSDKSDEKYWEDFRKQNGATEWRDRRYKATRENKEAMQDLYNTGEINFATGKFKADVLNRKQGMNDLAGMFGSSSEFFSKFGTAESKASVKAAFGDGKFGEAIAGATSKLGGFGKALGGASSALSELAGPLAIVLEILHMVGDFAGGWMQHEADMTKLQTKFEEITYEKEKRLKELETQQTVVAIEYERDIALKVLEVQGQNMLEGISFQNKQLVNSLNTALGTINGQTATEVAYSAAKNLVAAQAESAVIAQEREYRKGEQERYKDVRNVQRERDTGMITAERVINETEYNARVAETSLEKEQKIQQRMSDVINNFSVGSVAGGIGATFNNESSATAKISEGGRINENELRRNENPVLGGEYDELGRQNNNGAEKSFDYLTKYGLLGEGYLRGEQAKATARLENAAADMKRAADYQKVSTENFYNKQISYLESSKALDDKAFELDKERVKKDIEAAEAIKNAWLDTAKHIEDVWSSMVKASNRTALDLGILEEGRRENYQRYNMQIGGNVASHYGKTAEDAAAIQSRYSEAVGRNKLMSEMDYEKMFYMNYRTGDEGLTAQYASDMEIFNKGVEESVDLLDEALDNVNRIGINSKKYSKTLADNMKLASKYNFKGGTKGLMDMAKWAENTRFKLSSLESMLDKVQEGGMEGLITQAAGFQVLGGNAAIYSDPLGMLYDAYADPAAYARRMQNMTRGFGRFNRETGETDFNINESMQINQIAKLQGRSPSELREEIMRRRKGEMVGRDVSSSIADDKEKLDFVTNNASYKNGEWVVKVQEGENIVEKRVSELTDSMLKNIMPEDHQERVEHYLKEGVEYLRKIVSLPEQEEGQAVRQQTLMAMAEDETIRANKFQRMLEADKEFYDSFKDNAEKIKKNMEEATGAYKGYITLYNDQQALIKQRGDMLYETSGNLNKMMSDFDEIIETAGTDIDNVSEKFKELAKYVGDVNDIYSKSDADGEREKNKAEDSGVTKFLKTYKGLKDKWLGWMPSEIAARGMTDDLWGAMIEISEKNTSTASSPTSPKKSEVKGKTNEKPVIPGGTTSYTAPYSHYLEQNGFGFGDVFNHTDNILSNMMTQMIPVDLGSKNDSSSAPSNVSLTINGKLELVGQNGQSVDIINAVRTNPMMVRQLTELILKQMQNNANGGRNELFYNRFAHA